MVLAIVAVSRKHAAQRFCRAQIGAPAMILKAHQRLTLPLDDDVANAARRLWPLVNGPGIEDAQPPHIWPTGRTIVMSQQLIAAADGQHWHIVFNRSPQPNCFDLS